MFFVFDSFIIFGNLSVGFVIHGSVNLLLMQSETFFEIQEINVITPDLRLEKPFRALIPLESKSSQTLSFPLFFFLLLIVFKSAFLYQNEDSF